MTIENKIPAYEISKGETFVYEGHSYTALADPTGEFSTYVLVKYEDGPSAGNEGEIYLPSGSMVTVSDPE